MNKPGRIVRTILGVGMVGFGLSGCVKDQVIGGPIAQIGFQHLSKVRLNVASINIKSNYKGPIDAPNVEQRFSTPPEQAMFNWAMTRLVAVGGPENTGIANFVIQDGSVIETRLQKTKGFKGMFAYEPTTRYDATAKATMSITKDKSGATGTIRVTSKRSIEVSENATLAQREQAWMELVEKLMADFNTQMDVQIKGYMSRWVAKP
ncbi:MAG: hypothetical protein JKY92_04440 [Magnetovibrio sp.]|nr:hypothetical protein [Magnetovibrio sp.]